jgi:hypothetical protein
MFNSKHIKIALSAVAFAGALAAGSANASAAEGGTAHCTVSDIGSDNYEGPMRTTIHCLNDTGHYTAGNVNCRAVSEEQQKMWVSMATAALLSGKKLTIYWDDSCGSRAIHTIYMFNQ